MKDSEMSSFYVYRVPGAMRNHGYYITEAKELPRGKSLTGKDRTPPPLIWDGEASDADDALTKAKQYEDRHAQLETSATETTQPDR